jgi:hypothetical protein
MQIHQHNQYLPELEHEGVFSHAGSMEGMKTRNGRLNYHAFARIRRNKNPILLWVLIFKLVLLNTFVFISALATAQTDAGAAKMLRIIGLQN